MTELWLPPIPPKAAPPPPPLIGPLEFPEGEVRERAKELLAELWHLTRNSPTVISRGGGRFVSPEQRKELDARTLLVETLSTLVGEWSWIMRS